MLTADLPTSFTGQSFLFGLNNDVLFPTNKDQGSINYYLGKPIRCIARIIYGLATQILIAPVGIVYHLGAAAVNGLNCYLTEPHYPSQKESTARICDDLKTRSIQHLKCAGQDFIAALFTIPTGLGILAASYILIEGILLGVFNLPALEYGLDPKRATIAFQNPENRNAVLQMLMLKDSVGVQKEDGSLLDQKDNRVKEAIALVSQENQLRIKQIGVMRLCSELGDMFASTARKFRFGY